MSKKVVRSRHGIIGSVVSLLVFLVLLPGQSFADGFRNASWGMTMEEVAEAANEDLVTFEGDVYTVLGNDETYIFDLRCLTLYFFSHTGKLVKGGFFFENEYANPNKYIEDYEKLRRILVSVYGEGEHETVLRTDAVYHEAEYGKALLAGELALLSYWTSGDTHIELVVDHDRYGITLAIQFFSLQLYAEYEQMLGMHAELGSGKE